ncbi:MAG TPA: T9SS type A sorting domain-containing protein, partial [Rhodothermales bacterium]|nr:T9SS type A sorting domain-containing protein [Rhodothermales bacterium]
YRGDVGDIVSTGTEDELEMPAGTRLHPSYPNPFSSTTTVRYEVGEATSVRLEIFDVLGRYVSTLVDGRVSPGVHETVFVANGLPAGVYLARMEIGGRVLTERMILVQ